MAEPTIVTLEFTDDVRPPWLYEMVSCRLPVPPEEPRPLTGTVKVTGQAHHSSGQTRGAPLPLVAVGDDGQVQLAFDWARWRRYLFRQEWAPPQKEPAFARLPLHYHLAPGRLRNTLARWLAPVDGRSPTEYPGFPIEQGFEAVAHAIARAGGADHGGSESPRVVLTHDVDTDAGLARVRELAEREASLGFRSSWNFLCARYTVDRGLLDWLVERGHEVGCHGYNHDGRLAFLPEVEIRQRFDACRELITLYDIKGFRSPSYLRTPVLMKVVRDYFAYDLSVLDSDWICPGGKGGCLTARPYLLDDLVHLPTTVPAEMSFGPRGLEVGHDYLYWQPKIRWLRLVGGHAVVNTHPDPHYSGSPDGLAAYTRLLEVLGETFSGAWSLPRDLLGEARANAV